MGKPIAMRCNQEQFDEIKHLLKFSVDINDLDDNFCFLVSKRRNNYFGVNFYTLKDLKETNDYEIHETWNEQTFLEACGIKTEKQMKISKENIIKLDKKETTVRELFPEVLGHEEKFEITRLQIDELCETSSIVHEYLKTVLPKAFEVKVDYNEPILSLNDLLNAWGGVGCKDDIELYKTVPLFKSFERVAEDKLKSTKL